MRLKGADQFVGCAKYFSGLSLKGFIDKEDWWNKLRDLFKMVDLAFNYQVAHFEKCINGLDLIFKRRN